MGFIKGEPVIWSPQGIPTLVQVVETNDAENTVTIKQHGSTPAVVHVTELSPLEPSSSYDDLLTEDLLYWAQVLQTVQAQIATVQNNLVAIQAEVATGQRQQNSPLEVAEKEALRLLLNSFRYHAFNLKQP